MRGSYRGRPHGPRCTVLVKANGPAFGAGLTSHDLTEVHEAIAAEEVDKINCAVEKGSKVLLYLDDIGRGTWKLLQKFTSIQSSIHNHFNQEHHLHSRRIFKANQSAVLAEWRRIVV